jgi:hypothetical protein
VTTNNWGTSAYASPERLDRGHVNEHVDFWSLGIILYEMLTGHRPYPALDRNRSQLEQAIRTNAPREPLPDTCPPGLAAIVNKLLAYQIEHRYPSAAAIKADLELFLEGQPPAALAEYETPATVPIGQPTSRRAAAPDILQPVPPTDPLPATSAASSDTPVAGEPPRSRVRRGFRRFAWAVVLLGVIGVVATEGVACVAAERFHDSIGAIDLASLSETRSSYNDIRDLGAFGAGLCLRVNRPLHLRLISLADAVLEDYRREEPTMAAIEWSRALEALRWASEIGRVDSRTRAKLLTCEGHVIRLSARGQPAPTARLTFLRAVDKFHEAAGLDTESFDPYLGISRIAVYGLGDVDQAATAIEEAGRRGYESGRRERALLGDGYLRRANNSRLLAGKLSGEQKRRELERARADYAGCIDAFDGILGFGQAAANLELCKRQMERIERELLSAEDRLGLS